MKKLMMIVLVSSFLMSGWALAQSQQELDRACEDARSKKLEPEEREKINECKADKKNDPKWCENYWSDYGAGGKTGPKVRQRMYDDLPECVKAKKARQEVN